MKTTMTGSDLAGYMKPLAAKVKWHEGVDYDKIQMSVSERFGKKYLCAYVRQPRYMVDLHLNLSGSGMTMVDGKPHYDVDPRDATAEACTGGESYMVPGSKLQCINRNVGASSAVYRFDSTGALNVSMNGTTLILPGEKLDYPLLPFYATDQRDDELSGCTGCRIDADDLGKALDASIRMCRLNGSGTPLSLQAVHLCFREGMLYVEGFSNTGSTSNYARTTSDKKFANGLPEDTHLAISLDAARVLYMSNIKSGSEMMCSYQAQEHTITFSNNIYTLVIMTEDVLNCEMPGIYGQIAIDISVNRIKLLSAVSRASVAGYKNVVVSTKELGIMEIDSPDGMVQTALDMKMETEKYEQLEEFTLPVDSMIAAVGGKDDKEITITLNPRNTERIQFTYAGGEAYVDCL